MLKHQVLSGVPANIKLGHSPQAQVLNLSFVVSVVAQYQILAQAVIHIGCPQVYCPSLWRRKFLLMFMSVL
ncbi:hypothetical protein OFC53_34380, partial [Escherichia coli]|nr:hypothetical protein [Escherichia coli]